MHRAIRTSQRSILERKCSSCCFWRPEWRVQNKQANKKLDMRRKGHLSTRILVL